jgi:hypothetical protein
MCQPCKDKRDAEQQRRVEEQRRREEQRRAREELRKAEREEAERKERAKKEQQARKEAERREKELRLAKEEAERKDREQAARRAEEQRSKAALFEREIGDKPDRILDAVASLLQGHGVNNDSYGRILAFLQAPFHVMEVPENYYTPRAFDRFCQLRSEAGPRARAGIYPGLGTRPDMGGTEVASYGVDEADYFAKAPFQDRCVHLAVAGLAWWICQAVKKRDFWHYLEGAQRQYLKENLVCALATSLAYCPSSLRAEILKIIPYLPNARWAKTEVEWVMDYDKEPNNRFEARKVVAMIDPIYGPPKVGFKRRFFNED